MVGLRVDITELREAREAAQLASRAKTDFLNTLSHELRTPLTVILGVAQLVAALPSMPAGQALKSSLATDTGQSPQEKNLQELFEFVDDLINRLDTSANHLLWLVNQMLDFAKAEAGKLELHMERVDASSVVQPVVDQMAILAEQKGLKFNVDVDTVNVFADEARTRQILLNLLSNAIKFTETGSVSLTVIGRDDMVEFRITDTGRGVAEDQLDKIFGAFHQSDSTDSRDVGGTGLGLAIASRLAELQKGYVSAVSRLDQGSTFTLFLPAERIDQSLAA